MKKNIVAALAASMLLACLMLTACGGSEEEIIKGRLSGMLFDGYTADDVIITVNEEITD